MHIAIKLCTSLCVLGCLACTPVKSPSSHHSSAAPAAEKVVTKAPPTPEEMAKIYEQYGVPGPEHEIFKQLVGKWKYTSKMWMSPDKSPEVSSGTSDNKLILGGRFLEQNVKGTVMGRPFEGHGMMGFDRVKKEYTSVWIDNMMTGVMVSKGTFDQATKTIKEEGTFSCPMEGTKTVRTAFNVSDPKRLTYETYMKDPSGKEFKMMEITYSK